MSNRRIVRFRSEYLPVLAHFAGKNDIRQFLNGVHVMPHPEGGVQLTATNGHVGVVVHDQEGMANGNYINRINPLVLSQARKRGARPGWVEFFGELCALYSNGMDKAAEPGSMLNSDLLMLNAYSPEIEGQFPNIAGVFPKPEQVEGIPATFDARYLALLEKAVPASILRRDWGWGWTIHLTDESTSMVATFSHPDHRIAVLIMPLRDQEHAKWGWIEPTSQVAVKKEAA